MPVFAHPASLAGRISEDQRVGEDGLCDHRTGPDKRIGPNLIATNDGGISADGGSFFHVRFLILILANDGASGVDDIGKNHRRAQKNVVVAGNAGVDGYVILHFDIIAQYDIGRDHYVLPDVTAFSDTAIRHDVREVPYFGAFADLTAFVNYSRWVYENRVRHFSENNR